MRKLFLTSITAALALPSLAWAQSSVKISGIVDAGLRMDSGAVEGSMSSVGSGIHSASRFTFSGIEDLGEGWKTGFVLESGFGTDTGAGLNNPPGTPAGAMSFGRLSAVSVGSDRTGYLSFGRQYTPMWAISAGPANDPFGAGWLGGITTVYNFTARASNSFVYSYGYTAQTMLLPAPRNGLGVVAMWSMSEATSPAPKKSGEQLGANVSYGDGTWWVGYGFHKIRGSNTFINATAPVNDQPQQQQQTLGASYQMSFARLHVGFNRGKNGVVGAGAVDRSNWHLGATVPLAANQSLRLLYGKANDRTAANADHSTFQLGYQYDLSKRTGLYAGVGQIDNNANAAASLAGAVGTYVKGSTPRAVVVGIRHIF